MKSPRKQFRKLYRWSWYLLASAILFSAVIISLLRFALTEIDSYREKIENLASNAIQHRVFIESMDAHLVGITPTLILNGVHVMDEEGKREILRIDQTSVGVAVIQSLRMQRFVPSSVTLSGTRLALVRRSNGRIALQGFNLENQNIRTEENNNMTEWFFSQTAMALKDSTLVWKDYKRGSKRIVLNNIDIELNNQGSKHQLAGSFAPASSLGKRVEVAMQLEGNLTNPSSWQGEFFMQGDEIYLTHWGEVIKYKDTQLKTGIADFQLWGEMQEGQLRKANGDISIYQVKVVNEKKAQQLDVSLLGGLFELNVRKQGWSLAVNRFQYTGTGGTLPETSFSVMVDRHVDATAPNIDVRVGSLNLQSISEVLLNSSVLEEQQEKWLRQLQPSGMLNTVRFHRYFNSQQKQFEFMAHAQLDRVSSHYINNIPGISNLSGNLWLDQQQGQLTLESEAGSIDFGDLFRAPIKLQKVQGQVDWLRLQHGWQVNSSELQVENNDVTTRSNVSVYLPDKGPAYMDLYTSFAGNVQAKSDFLPVRIMKPELVKWLDQSLVSGVVSNAGAVYRGRFADFPFRDPAGQFMVKLYTDNLELNYKPGWPQIHDADLDASFDSKGVRVDISLARLFSSAITHTRIAITDYRQPTVDISGKVQGNMGDVVRFVVKSPIKVSEELLDMQYEGRATTTVDLHVPLQEGASTGYNGVVKLSKGSVGLLGGAVKINNINGDLKFTNDGLNSENLTATVLGHDSSINVYSQVIGDRVRTYLATNGSSDSAEVLKQFSVPAYQHVNGRFNWQALLDFADDKLKVPVLHVTSDLAGVEVNMPAPFNKPAQTRRDLSLNAYFMGQGRSDLFLGYGDDVSLALQFKNQKPRLAIEKGQLRLAKGAASLPRNKLLYVTGGLKNFSPARWGDYAASYKELNDVQSGSLPIYLKMSQLDVVLDGKKQSSSQMQPGSFPRISGSIDHFVFDGMSLGKLDIDIKPVASGLQVDKLHIVSPEMDFTSSGNWTLSNRQHLSTIKVNLKSNNMGKLFKRVGLAAIIENGKANIHGDLHWSGTPFEVSLGKLEGNLNLLIEDGSIADINPGAGRVVGLLSLSELPRRLMLDFSDMFKKGFVFDDIRGAIKLSDGNGYTQAIKVDSSVADINLSGRTGLVARDYDLQVQVIPKVGDTLPVASGALFGAQIGAIVYLFDKLMGKPLEKATERKYHVTGSWEKPVIKRTDVPAENKPARKQ